MIKNIIFDLSGVLLDYDISKYFASIGLTEQDAKIYKPLIWGSNEWLLGDKNLITYNELINSLVKKYPKHTKMRYILENKNNDILLSDKKETVAFVKELKEKGFKIYFLSNVWKCDIDYNINRFEFFKLADGAVYSCDVESMKPEKECYLALLNKYNLKPEECIFIDDIKENVEAANKLGIKGILFDNVENVRKSVNDIIV